jgi:histidyl-tRNA synthetase
LALLIGGTEKEKGVVQVKELSKKQQHEVKRGELVASLKSLRS